MAANHRKEDYRKNNCRFSRVEDLFKQLLEEVTHEESIAIIQKHLNKAIKEETKKFQERLKRRNKGKRQFK